MQGRDKLGPDVGTMACLCRKPHTLFQVQRRPVYLTRKRLPVLSATSGAREIPAHVHVASYHSNICVPKLPLNCSFTLRDFHFSVSMSRKFKESDYERLKIYDPNGEYICTAEMIVLSKFCHQFHRYTMKEMEKDTSKTEASADEQNLRAFQIIDKKAGQTTEKEEMKKKKTKEIRFHKDASAEPKLTKILEILVDLGKVNIEFEEKGSKVEKEVRRVLEEYATFKSFPREHGAFYFANVKELDSDLLQKLFNKVYEEQAVGIAEVRKLILDGKAVEEGKL